MPLAVRTSAETPVTELIEAIRQGDRSAFAAFVRENQRWVRGVVFGVLGRADEVDDITQEVWEAVWTRIDDLRAAESWRGWLYRLARNAALDAGRSRSRAKRLREQAPVDLGERVFPPPVAALCVAEDEKTVLEAIRSLPAMYREPFVLRHLQGWSYQQIAEAMAMPAATVETRLVRARQQLRESLQGKL